MADHRRSKSAKLQSDVDAVSEQSAKRRVWIFVPFAQAAQSGVGFRAPNLRDPHEAAAGWATSKNLDPARGDKVYEKIGFDDLARVDFGRGDRLYIHGHGSREYKESGQIWDHANNSFTAEKLRDDMKAKNPDIFASDKIDIRMASCYSADQGVTGRHKRKPLAQLFAEALQSEGGGKVKGYSGQLNVVEMTMRANRREQHKLAGLNKNDKGNLVADKDRAREISYRSLQDRAEFRAGMHSATFDIPAAPSSSAKTAKRKI